MKKKTPPTNKVLTDETEATIASVFCYSTRKAKGPWRVLFPAENHEVIREYGE